MTNVIAGSNLDVSDIEFILRNVLNYYDQSYPKWVTKPPPPITGATFAPTSVPQSTSAGAAITLTSPGGMFATGQAVTIRTKSGIGVGKTCPVTSVPNATTMNITLPSGGLLSQDSPFTFVLWTNSTHTVELGTKGGFTVTAGMTMAAEEQAAEPDPDPEPDPEPEPEPEAEAE